MSPEKSEKDFYSCLNGQTSREEGKRERRSPFSVCDLYITEPEEQLSHRVKDVATPFRPAGGRKEANETHI